MLIETLIDNSGYKRQYVATYLDVSRPTLNSRLNHESYFKPDEFNKLAYLLRIPVEELISLYEEEIKKDEI